MRNSLARCLFGECRVFVMRYTVHRALGRYNNNFNNLYFKMSLETHKTTCFKHTNTTLFIFANFGFLAWAGAVERFPTKIILLRFVDSRFLGNSPWTWEFHPLNLILCLGQTLWSSDPPSSFLSITSNKTIYTTNKRTNINQQSINKQQFGSSQRGV